MTPLRIGPKQVAYQNQYQQIYRVAVEFDGFTKELFVNDYGQRVGVLFVRGEHVLLVRQYRFLVNQLAWEIPGGRSDPDEVPEAGAAREALEETGLQCRTLKPLLYFHPGLDTFDNPTFTFYSDDFEETPVKHADPHEVCEPVWVPLARCLQMIFAGDIVDSLTIAAVLAFHTLKMHPESLSHRPGLSMSR